MSIVEDHILLCVLEASSEFVRRLREERGLTLRELSRRSGVSETTLSLFEASKRQAWSRQTAMRVLQALHRAMPMTPEDQKTYSSVLNIPERTLTSALYRSVEITEPGPTHTPEAIAREIVRLLGLSEAMVMLRMALEASRSLSVLRAPGQASPPDERTGPVGIVRPGMITDTHEVTIHEPLPRPTEPSQPPGKLAIPPYSPRAGRARKQGS